MWRKKAGRRIRLASKECQAMRPLPRHAPERAKRRSMRHDARMRTSSIALPALVLALSCAGNVTRAHAEGSAAPSDSATRAIAFPSAADRRWQTGFARRDRLQHASLSFVLAGACRTAGRTRGESFAFTLSLGVLKEVRDARRSKFDVVDLAADAIGAALGSALPGEGDD